VSNFKSRNDLIMKTLLSILLVLSASVIFWSCDEDPLKVSCDNAVFATVKDLTGLDGCGFVFELADGTKLEPQMLGYCGTPPLPKEVTENPLYNFQFTDGKQVRIGFEEVTDAASICMVGKIVKITCIEEFTPAE
jgi:hypothetical protein